MATPPFLIPRVVTETVLADTRLRLLTGFVWGSPSESANGVGNVAPAATISLGDCDRLNAPLICFQRGDQARRQTDQRLDYPWVANRSLSNFIPTRFLPVCIPVWL